MRCEFMMGTPVHRCAIERDAGGIATFSAVWLSTIDCMLSALALGFAGGDCDSCESLRVVKWKDSH